MRRGMRHDRVVAQRHAGDTMSDIRGVIVGAPSAASDQAIARWYEQWLERKHPGITWRVREAGENLRGLEIPSRKINGTAPGGVDDDGIRVAA